ncbi:MAG: serine/threonine protein kinase [Actinomycetota bacterium]|nr:serine/threonine protein kinase [Actinomycetota bacterium]
MSEDLTGRRLGHYQVDGVIGKGGMAVMYRATDVRLGRKVALKVIAEHLSGDAEFRERFIDEARNTSAVDHSHVVPLYDFGEVDGLLYIAMRFVDGSDLASLISRGPISPARTLSLLGQVADALEMLADRGLVHLDVKPANVLVTSRESAGGEHVYLADFGLTRRGATGHRTSSGDFLGSPTYAAPEHLRGEPVDPRTDQYALACVMFVCLTGRPPFQGKVPEVIQGHLGSEPPAVSSLVVLPPAIDDVIRRGMAKDPQARYPNCGELLFAARAALETVARPASPPLVRRHSKAKTPRAPAPAPAGNAPPVSALPRAASDSPPDQQSKPPLRPTHPVRLRDPLPAQPAPFATSGSDNVWVVPAVIGLTLLGLVLVVVLLLVGGNDGDDARDGSGEPVTTSPSIGVGDEGRPLPSDLTVPTR